MLTRVPQSANNAEWSFWQQLPPQIDTAVRKVFHWERTDVMSTEEFRERVAQRTLHNFTSDARKKMAAGISFADWKAQIKNLEAWLTTVARRASIDEMRKVLHERAKEKLPTKEELRANLKVLSLKVSHDPTTQVLTFLRAELPLRQERAFVEHVRCCGSCFERMKKTKFMLREFLHSGRMNPELVLLAKVIGMEKEASEIALISRNLADREIMHLKKPGNHIDSEEKRRDMIRFFLSLRTNLDLSLDALGCSQSQRRRRQNNDYWLIYQNRFIDMENRITLILYLATGRLNSVRAWAGLKRVQWPFLKFVAKEHFDQILTNDPKSRSTKPTKSTFQRNPPCAREMN